MTSTVVEPARRPLERERKSLTHKFEMGGHEGYVTVGLYADGSPGEIFFAGFGKEGSFLQCMIGCWAKAMSNSLQYGQPVAKLVTNYLDMRFEPYGRTANPLIPEAKSTPDYDARWLALSFLSEEERDQHGIRL
jgi:ribonucleoside-diphosphate reductase alpha chain